ncbi:MAG: 30S ribosome-binding factor RbfA [Desulfobacteraceae bacterium]|nr:30S ribosome-binding factor RbfA [Desulfobacteraceae bacterium]MDH3573873.1 30S ribosome-binding factor RbfA [Desulfobacteraceae bacterium]MDH3721257.1 30S ribosome-binding factor RbfA [Desulfobacteraceae bacterium]MDH3836885.1 30S ribosome-binding factor RbfA [Desulfobacteraceae bacterium]MDH3872942.1 30S ribosome-binding factor RbfA [Desulfobacteraceae bacterium]
MKPFVRSDRVSGQIQKVLSEILLKKIKDPRLEAATITSVKMSRDLKFARVYFVTSGGKESMEEATEGFKSALGYVKRKLAAQLGLRYMPELRFFYDDSFDYGSHIDKIIKTVKSEDEFNNTTI